MSVAYFSRGPVDPAVDAERKRQQEVSNKVAMALISAQREVKEQLKDPDSAKFGAITFGRNKHVCGYVNAKNSFGAYSGQTEFMSADPFSSAWLNDGSESFREAWAKHCGR